MGVEMERLREIIQSDKISANNVSCEIYPVGNYMFKVKNRNARTRCEISSKLTIKISERRNWGRSDLFIVNFKHILHLVLVFLFIKLMFI